MAQIANQDHIYIDISDASLGQLLAQKYEEGTIWDVILLGSGYGTKILTAKLATGTYTFYYLSNAGSITSTTYTPA